MVKVSGSVIPPALAFTTCAPTPMPGTTNLAVNLPTSSVITEGMGVTVAGPIVRRSRTLCLGKPIPVTVTSVPGTPLVGDRVIAAAGTVKLVKTTGMSPGATRATGVAPNAPTGMANVMLTLPSAVAVASTGVSLASITVSRSVSNQTL
ncbi:MAG: hypothetical protein DDT32_02219 [Syntrophomonadaceae bacterium]|nr:hypothetical protein [Bacillota bacterium]